MVIRQTLHPLIHILSASLAYIALPAAEVLVYSMLKYIKLLPGGYDFMMCWMSLLSEFNHLLKTFLIRICIESLNPFCFRFKHIDCVCLSASEAETRVVPVVCHLQWHLLILTYQFKAVLTQVRQNIIMHSQQSRWGGRPQACLFPHHNRCKQLAIKLWQHPETCTGTARRVVSERCSTGKLLVCTSYVHLSGPGLLIMTINISDYISHLF